MDISVIQRGPKLVQSSSGVSVFVTSIHLISGFSCCLIKQPNKCNVRLEINALVDVIRLSF